MDPAMIQRLADIEARMYRLSDVDPHLKVGVYSRPGVGKTALVGSMVEMCPEDKIVIIGDAEHGDTTLRLHYPPSKYPNLRIFPIEKAEDCNDMYMFCLMNKDRIYGVALDTLTEIQKKFMGKILRENHQANPQKHDPDVAQLADWGKNTEQMRKLIRAFRDLPMHVWFTAHHDVDKDEQTGARELGPAVTPKLRVDFTGAVDVIGYMFAVEEEGKTVRRMLTQPTQQVIAKCRMESRVPRVMNNPKFADLYWAVMGGKPQQ
jgi:hypothetical protein